ncbi:flagellar basal body P-ring protein FlgI [Candidatus Magnetominusculus xianensis]|uniref:Flagellar P-ring protein n=1 Tax=Candidatus Magnetominusculus xianensis TaxID=1748249 RepID=A0ABR5SF34_9BACT|nr:flagellar basal body P-ring protein FlgI [Candidatus Magnetominusculus xianensis]KWT85388.1 flagellar basal body P-ring biosynthesis [Candidatus Magnetominusculus xianensis]MBF0405133.1 flagellar basal body P-ring protein FlgI [Nitrospirota bacterium]
MKTWKTIGIVITTALFIFSSVTGAYCERLKDISSIKGVRDNQLVGYGLVVGLGGTGDKKGSMVQSIINMMMKMGISVNQKDIISKNVAAVMVTADLPAFPKIGKKIDANVSAMGDAKSLMGGMLLLTPLVGADGKTYATAQGAVSIGGIYVSKGGSSAQQNFATVGRVPNGASIEKEFGYDIANSEDITLVLRDSDFTTATNIRDAINKHLRGNFASSPDPSSVKVIVPPTYQGNVVELINKLEALDVRVDIPAKIIVNERTGTVVIGESVKLTPVAIAHGDLTIEITQNPQQLTGPQTEINVNADKAALTKISGATLGEIITSLNKLGVTPRDLIAILQSLKSAGALTAQLEIQ